MRIEVHVHADIPIIEGVTRRQVDRALAPWIEYLDAEAMGDVKSLEADEPGIKYDEKEYMLRMCWTGEVGRSFPKALEECLDNLGPYCHEAVEVELTVYHDNGTQESKLLFVGPTPEAIHEAQRRCMIEDVVSLLGRQFSKEEISPVTALVTELFKKSWADRATKPKPPERAFETSTRPARKHLH